MTQESDGVHEFAQGQMRTALLVACQVGEALARAREARLRQLENADREEAAALSVRLDAERKAASARLAPARQPGWAATASAGVLEQAVKEAEQWRSDDPTAEHARRELYDWAKGEGLDFEQMQADIDALRASLLAKQAAELRATAADRDDPGAEILRMAAEDLQESVDAAVGQQSATPPSIVAGQQTGTEVDYDSPQRRATRAAQLTANGVPEETVQAAMVADLSGALPVVEAVVRASAGRSPAKARVARRGQSRDSDRIRGR